MPIYEYQCQNCGHKMEAIQSISAEPLLLCPECEQPKLQKLISASGFQLKGSGWYVTDYSKKAKSTETATKAGTSDSQSTPLKTEAKSPTKPTDTSSSSGSTTE